MRKRTIEELIPLLLGPCHLFLVKHRPNFVDICEQWKHRRERRVNGQER